MCQFEAETENFILYRGGDYPLTMDDLDPPPGRGVEALFLFKDFQAPR